MKQRIALALLSFSTFVSACSETVNISPVARLTVPENARVNKTLVFDASSSSDAEGAIATYRFDFGDGTDAVAGVARTEHLFATAGAYVVTLTVIDKDGARASTRVDLVVRDNQAPVAVLNGPVLATVGQLVSFDSAASTDEDGEIVSQEIDFGDGSAKGKNPAENHVYQVAGLYKVVLTVTDNEKATATLNRTIQVQSGAQAAVAAPLARLLVTSDANATESLTFDASASTAPGALAAYKIYFGDGADDTGRSVNHAYAAAGNYTALLMVTATYPDGSTAVSIDARQIRVRALNSANPLPTAAFAAPASARFGSTVILDGSSSTTPGATSVTYAWNFGDAGTANNALTSHAYAASNYYSIQLTVTATYADGTSSVSVASKIIYIVGNTAPVAMLSAPATGLVSDPLLFSAAGSMDSDGSIAVYNIDFGDGNNVNGTEVVHTYAAPGNYTVVLTTTDNDGATHTATKVVRVDSYNTAKALPLALLNGPVQLITGQSGAFTISGSSAPDATATYKIYFGDGQTFTGAASTHAYAAPGNYLAGVLLTATYPDATTNVSITYLPVTVVAGSAANAAPVADFNAPSSVRFSETVALDAGISTAPGATSVDYAWDFGDGNLDNGQSVNHVYAAGTYTITLDLTVTYGDGSVATARRSRFIEVRGNVAPMALLTNDTNGLATDPIQFNGSASHDLDGSIATYSLDFGDGSPATNSLLVSHAYVAGTWVATLTVTDNDGDSTVITREITVSAYNTVAVPPIAVLTGPNTLGIGQVGVFTSAGSTAPNSVASYKIYFGDGATSTDAAASHAYTLAGNYIARLLLVATYPDGSTNSSVSVVPVEVSAASSANVAPVVNFTHSASIRFSQEALFDAGESVAENAVSVVYDWDFGDGVGGAGQAVAHDYSAAGAGNYAVTVTLTANYSDGSFAVGQRTHFIEVRGNIAPVAKLSGDTEGLASQPLYFDASESSDVDGIVTLVAIDFNDGSPVSNSLATSHVYTLPGTYDVTLTVTDNDADTHTITRTVTISPFNTNVQPPIAVLSGPTRLGVGQTGVFSAVGSSAPGAMVTYRHYFGDGVWADGASVSHQYTGTANLTASVLLVATYPDNSTSVATAVLPVEVVPESSNFALPTADFTAPSSARFDEEVLLDAGASTAPGATSVNYDWDFGDGNFGNGVAVNYTYFIGGTYNVTLTVTANYSDGSSTQVQRTKIVSIQFNNAPVAVLTGPTEGFTSVPVSFDGSQSVDSDGTLNITEIDFGDGSPIASFLSASHVYTTPGNYTVTLYVEDNDGDSHTVDHDINIASISTTFDAPVVSVNGPSALAVNEAGLFSLTGTAPGATLSYSINFDDGVVASNNSSLHTYAAAGDYNVVGTLIATYADATTRWTSSVFPVRVEDGSVANAAPTAVFTAPSSLRFTSPLVVDAGASAAPNATSIAYNWTFGDGNVATGVSAVHTYAAVSGTFPVQLTVVGTYSDGTTAYSQSTKVVMLVANAIPNVNFTGPTQSIVGEAVSFDSTSSNDSDGTIVSRVIDFGDASTSANAVASHSYAAAGTYEVTLSVTDNDGAMNSMVREIRVFTTQEAGNTPVARIMAPTIGFPSSLLTLDGSGSTAETGFISTYFWELGDGRAFNGASSINVTYTTRGLYTFALTVTNSAGLSNRIERQISILNAAPVLASAALNAGPHYETSVIQVTPSGWSDSDGDAPQYYYRWVVDGIEVAGETGSSLNGLSFSKGATVQAEVTPFDSFNFGTRVWSNIATIDNSSPSLASADLGGSIFREADTITVTPVGWADVDGDVAGYTYQWYVNTLPVLGATTSSLDGLDFDKGDSVYVEVTPDDGDIMNNPGAPVNSATVVIENTTPVIDTVVIGASPSREANTVSFVSATTWVDDDGDAQGSVFQWYIDVGTVGTWAAISGQINPTLTGASFNEGDSVRLRVWPNDGETLGAFVDSNVVPIVNTAPVALTAVINGGPHFTDSVLTASATGTDDDSEPITANYNWFVNGGSVQSSASNTLNGATMFDKTDTVYVEVTYTDGSGFGAAATSATVTIQNSAPAMASVVLSAGPYTESTTITATPSATDADGVDTVAYTYNWYVNGSLVPAISGVGAGFNSIDGADFSKGNSVYVSVTPTDDDAVPLAGTAMQSATVAIANTAPVISSAVVSPGSPNEASTISVAVTASDIDGDVITYTYQWKKNTGTYTNIVGATNAMLTGADFAKGDDIRVDVTASDGTASSVVLQSTNPVVVVNTVPVMTSVSLNAGPFVEASTITATPASTDDDGDLVSYAYDWFVNGLTSGITANNITGANFAKGDTVFVRVTPSDPAAGLPMDSATVTIGNTAPTLTSATIASIGNPAYGTDATFYVDAWVGLADVDAADTLTLHYQWKVNGTPVIGQTARTLSGVYVSSGESVSVDVIAFDGTVEGDVRLAGPALVIDTPPTIAGVTIDPGTYYIDTPIVAGAFGEFDADGGVTTVEYAWYVDNVIQASMTDTLPAGTYARGATVFTAARALNNGVYSGYVSSPSITIQNRKPVMDTLVINAAPLPATEGSTLSYTATSHDDDLDTVTEQRMWVVNGSATGITGATLTGANFDKDDVVSLSITPYDGMDVGTPMISNITIQNTAPAAPGLVVTEAASSDIYADILTASTDVDSDTVSYTYVWTIDGDVYPSTATNIAAINVTSGTWKVVVTPNDGFANGATSFAQITISDWIAVSSTGAPTGRHSHTAVWTGSEMIVWGGNTTLGATRLNTGGRYNPATDTWFPTAATTLSARESQKAVWTGSQMIVWGGLDNAGIRVGDGGRYNPTTDTWQSMAAAGLIGRVAHAMVWTGSEVIVWGGVRTGAPFYLGDGARYDPVTDSWTAVAGSPITNRYSFAYAWTDKELLVWGGFDAGLPNTGARYDPVADSWTLMSTIGAPSGREFPAAVWTGSQMLVWGGNGGGIQANGAAYAVSTDTWTPISAINAPTVGFATAQVWTGREMLIWGGLNTSAAVSTDGGSYDPRTDTWSQLDTPILSARQNHSAVWTGREAIFFGGWDGAAALGDGASYVPPAVTEAWIATDTSSVDLPSARLENAIVWTGTEMIVWGGHNGAIDTNTGGRYNPATDTWLPTSTVAAPAATHLPASAWISGQMVVWGGTPSMQGGRYDPSTDTWQTVATLNEPAGSPRYYFAYASSGKHLFVWGGFNGGFPTDGGLYDPVNDLWTPTGLLGTPPPLGRHHAKAVWTGSEFIVFGGYDGPTTPNEGYAFSPTTTTWRAISTVGAAAGRMFPALVWTGSEMVVWGGEDIGGTKLNTTGRYYPDTDTWAPTSASSTITGRNYMNHVWTGREMIVLGGDDGSIQSDGARYDPRNDQWYPVLGTGAPAARFSYNPNSVWTGQEMIVWGGSNGAALNTGGRYTPPRP